MHDTVTWKYNSLSAAPRILSGGLCEDQVFLTKFYLSGKVLFANRVWDYYRQHEKSCMASTSFTGFYQARESYLRWLDAYLESHPAGEPQAQAAVGEKLDRVWWQWHSKSFKRRSICRAGKVLSPALMVRAYSAWSKLRRSTMAGGAGSLYPSGLGSLFLL